jgi:hypothetical protein
MALWRAFFPSWRFFVEAGPELKLQIRLSEGSAVSLDWTDALAPIPRTWTSFPFNAQGNFLHACHNSLQHLSVDLRNHDHSDQIEGLASYRIILNLARFQIHQLKLGEGYRKFQFRILILDPSRPAEEMLISSEYGL